MDEDMFGEACECEFLKGVGEPIVPVPPVVPRRPMQAFPSMEPSKLDRFDIERMNVEKEIRDSENDRRCSKSVFVSKHFATSVLQRLDCQRSEIEVLKREKRKAQELFSAQAEQGYNRIRDVSVAYDTALDALHAVSTKNVHPTETVPNLVRSITSALPPEMARKMQRVVNDLSLVPIPSKDKENYNSVNMKEKEKDKPAPRLKVEKTTNGRTRILILCR